MGEGSTCTGGPGKVGGPPQHAWTSSYPLRARIGQKEEEGGNRPSSLASVFELGHPTSFPVLGQRTVPLAPLVLRPLDSEFHHLGLRMAEGRWQALSAAIIMWTNSSN